MIKRLTFSLLVSLIMAILATIALHASEATGTSESTALTAGETLDGVLHVSAPQAHALLTSDGSVKVLDVRTKWEFNGGHIDGAVSINYYWFGFDEKLAKLDKDATWLVHCKSGVRSDRTLRIMKDRGFTSLIHLKGGIDEWKGAGLPLITRD